MDWIILAETSTDFQWIIQAATSGGFAALAWYLVVKHMPSIASAHLTERKEWLEYIKTRDAKYESLVEKCITAIETHRRPKDEFHGE